MCVHEIVECCLRSICYVWSRSGYLEKHKTNTHYSVLWFRIHTTLTTFFYYSNHIFSYDYAYIWSSRPWPIKHPRWYVCICLWKHKYLTLLISCTFDSESRQLISHFCDLRFMHVYEIAERGLGSIHVDYICWSTGVRQEPTCLL